MRRLILGAALVLWAGAAQAQMLKAIVADTHQSGATYTGPGDLATFDAWYGLRAFSAADRGNALVNVCNSTGGVDVLCADMVSDATTGALVSQSIGGITCPGANCTIKTFYVKGNGNGVDVTQATVSKRPTLPASCTTISKPCATFTRANAQLLAAATTPATTLTQPFSMYAVYDSTGSLGFTQTAIGASNNGGGNAAFISPIGGDLVRCSAGTSQNVTATDATWHVVQLLANGASSDCHVDATTNIGDAGTNSLDLRVAISAQNYLDTSYLDGLFVEAGAAAGSIASINSNAKAYWGF